METVTDVIFLGSTITVDSDCSLEIKTLVSGMKSYGQPRQHLKAETLLCQQGLSSQSYGFPISHVCIRKLDYEDN